MSNQGQAKTLNSSEHQMFLKYLKGTRHPERDILMYLLTYRAGMRIGCVAQLKVSDIAEVQVQNRSVKPMQVCVLRKEITKGSKTTMAYLSHPELQQAIVNYLQIPHARHPELVFVTQKGFPLIPNVASQIMLKHYNNAGFHGSSSHSGRSGFATNCLKGGLDIVAVSKLMGHTSLNTTMKYIRHNQQELTKMVANI